MSLRERIATPEGKRRYVRTLFATIADRYDLITRVLSYGQDRRWKRRLVSMAAPAPGMSALDLATGTGDIAFALAERGANVVGLDLTLRMIELAKGKQAAQVPGTGARHQRQAPVSGTRERAALHFIVGDMQALPFPAASFDLVTTGYGLRNVPDLVIAIDEIRRVLKPGGRLLSLDFNRPQNPLVRSAYLMYLSMIGGALGWTLHGDPDTYRYIPASIRNYPGAEAVAGLMKARGFTRATHNRVLGGLMAIHDAD
jgi:ubiquinone/menaquinone biosynthesis methyltransferase